MIGDSPDMDSSCGCEGPTGTDSKCDCEMQGECLCDGTCQCKSSICKEKTKTFR